MTAVAPTTQRPVATPAAAPTAAEAWHLRLVAVLVVLIVLGQRIGISSGGSIISLAVPLAYGFVALSLTRHLLVVSRLRAGLLTLAVSACLLTTAAVSWLGLGSQFSMSSLMLLVVTYVPWVLRAQGRHGAAVVARAGRAFLWTMLALSVLGMGQLSAQLAGVWEWEDYLAEVVPAEYRYTGYNFSNALTYGNAVNKSTAFVLLEPSFLSQFCALAILIGIMLRVRSWQLLVLAGGLASAVSGTGLILLAAGGLLLLFRAPGRLRISYVVVGVAVPLLVLQSPIAPFLLDRQGEVTQEGTSGNARFVAPFEAVWAGLEDDPVRFFVGAGPGSVERVIPGERISTRGTDVLYSVVPKLAFEYGILAGGLFALFLLLAMIDRAPWRVIPGALVLMVFVLSGALLQPQTAVLAWLLSGIGASGRDDTPRPSG